MNITYKPLSELPIKQASELWNKSFEGYIVNSSMPLDRFIARIGNDGLCMERSLACYVDGQPAGIVMNGFREYDGVLIARNGGTAIAPDYRGKGLGKAMMDANSAIYEEHGVQRAYLEAISTNEPAIKLYESVGYTLVDRLLIMGMEQAVMEPIVNHTSYRTTRGLAIEAQGVPFYYPGEVWQTDIPNMKDGESVLVHDGDDLVGYGLFKRSFDEQGKVTGITLFRFEAAPGRLDGKLIINAALSEILHPDQPMKRSAFNIRSSNSVLVELLDELGYVTTMEQVLMVRAYDEQQTVTAS